MREGKNYKSKRYYVGAKFKTNQGDIAEIVGKDINTKGNFLIKFIIYKKNNFIKSVQPNALINGRVKNPYYPHIYNIGYFGNGKYKAVENNKTTKVYSAWNSMLKRCYCKKSLKKHPSYSEVTVCEEWLDFQNFAEWYENNFIEYFEIDKDLLSNEKIYNPKNCCFLPVEINSFLTKNDINRGDYKIGVKYDRRINKYIARISISNKRKHIGVFKTENNAYEAYLKEKKIHLIQLANKYKEQLNKNVYNYLINTDIKIILNLEGV